MLLSEYIGQGDWRLFFLHRDRVRAATVEDVRAAAAAYLKPSNRTVGMFLPTAKPDRAEIPPPPAVAALVEGYKGDPPIAAGEAFDPSPANIDSRTKRSELPGGMKLALLPKKTRGETVVGIVILRFGDLKSLEGKAAAPDLAADMLMRGTTRRSRQQIQDELDRLKARITRRRKRRPGASSPSRPRGRTFPTSCASRPRSCASRRSRPRSSKSSARSTWPGSSSRRATRTRWARTSTSGT